MDYSVASQSECETFPLLERSVDQIGRKFQVTWRCIKFEPNSKTFDTSPAADTELLSPRSEH